MTNTDHIIELKAAVASLMTRVDKADERIDQLDSHRERVTKVELLLTQLVEDRKESRGRSSLLIVSITSAVLGAVVGAITTFLIQRYASL